MRKFLMIICLLPMIFSFALLAKEDSKTTKLSRTPAQMKLNDELIEAVRAVDLERVKRAIANGASPDATVLETDETPIFLTLCENSSCPKKNEKLAILKYLLDQGADPNARDAGTFTFSMWAAMHYDFDSLRILLSKPYKTDTILKDSMKDSTGMTALLWIKVPGTSDDVLRALNCVRVFKDYGKDLNQKTTNDENLAKLATSMTAPDSYIIQLHKLGVNVDLPSKNGTTPIMDIVALSSCSIQIVKYLVETAHVNINAKNKKGSVLDFASEGGNLEVAKYLRSKGAKYSDELIR